MNGLKAALCLALVLIKTTCAESPEDCFRDTKYERCSSNGDDFPASCECDDNECYFNLTITKKGNNYFINDEKKDGPTLIVKENATVVVDVFNKMEDNTSIHFHGMHQWNTPWMDGVAQITQWPVQPGGSFRHIFKALPSGTHWYHSHVGYQRDNGLVGAFIVREKHNCSNHSVSYVDEPGSHTILITEQPKQSNGLSHSQKYCFPDRSTVPDSLDPDDNNVEIDGGSPYINEKMAKNFTVDPSKVYRFRLIGATKSKAVRFSIDFHKLTVIAADGYLVNEFVTDFIIVHIGERYDFLFKADLSLGTEVFMRFDSLEVDCRTGEPYGEIASAKLVYRTSGSDKSDNWENVYDPSKKCNSSANPCHLLNCPFEAYKKSFNMTCHSISELKLCNTTAPNDVPDSQNISLESTWFLDFSVVNDNPAINNIQLKPLPEYPLQLPDSYTMNDNICNYTDKCEDNNKKCIHMLDIPDHAENIRFVISSIGQKYGNMWHATTHPVHLHGHSFFVAKIGYPKYYNNGSIQHSNQDLIPYHLNTCGPTSWNGTAPSDILTDSTTVRKDMVVVPAGGYVVIEFKGNNPGYWFMHCHIDGHLNEGMAIVVRERKKCQNQPPESLVKPFNDFCWNVSEFEKKLEFNCPPEQGKMQDEKTTESPYPEDKEEPDQKFLHQHRSPDDLMNINNRPTGSFKRTRHTKRTQRAKRTQRTKRTKRTQRTQRTKRTKVNRHQEMRELRKQSRQKQRIEDDWLGFDGIPKEPLMSHL